MFARLCDRGETSKGTKFLYTNYYRIHKWDITVAGTTFKGLSDEEYDFFFFNF